MTRAVQQRVFFLSTLFLSLAFCRACIWRPATNHDGAYFNQGKNGLWLGVEWVNEPQTSTAIRNLAKQLESLDIYYVFVYASYLNSAGEFNPTYTYATSFISHFHETYPNSQLLAWVGVPLQQQDIGDPAIRQKIAMFCQEMLTLGFDGIHLNAEPIWNDNQDLLLLLEDIRAVLGEDTFLSLATHRLWFLFPDAAWQLGGLSDSLLNQIPMWQIDYYQAIAARTDQITVMVYDSRLPDSRLYQQWNKFQVIDLTQALAQTKTEILIGIPTYDTEGSYHDASAENMVTGLNGTLAGLNDKATIPSVITGVAIYAEWTTDETEWESYKTVWLGEP